MSVAWADGKFSQDLDIAGHRLRADEETEKGGDNSGPAPHELLLAALGSCTAMTLRVYAERKGWPLRNVRVVVSGATGDDGLVIGKEVVLEGDLDAEQRLRLMEIADRCPVHKSLSGKITINSVEKQA